MTKQRVTEPELATANRIIKMIEAGSLPPWRRTWSVNKNDLPRNASGRVYKGANLWMLLMAPYDSPFYMTQAQITKLGGHVKEDELKNYWPVFWWSPPKAYKDKKTGENKSGGWFCMGFNVWNVEQVEGLKKVPQLTPTKQYDNNPIEVCENIIAGFTDAPLIKYIGNYASYNVTKDYIKIPECKRFQSTEEFYATLFHELAHSTGHSKRLNRSSLTEVATLGDHKYSEEELVAEFSSAMLCNESGIAQMVIDNQAAYISHWLSNLQNRPEMLVIAVRNARKAFKHIRKEELFAE
jgi:antirestriction protein ArdC